MAKYPKGMSVVIDTREQKPLFIPRVPKKGSVVKGGLEFIGNCLPHGDYSLWGFEKVICVERKRALETYSWIGRERKKTEAKLEAMNGLYWKALVIEGTVDKLYTVNSLKPAFRKENSFITKTTPYQVRRSLAAFEIKYGLHIYYAKSRADAQRWILDRFEFFYKHIRSGLIKL